MEYLHNWSILKRGDWFTVQDSILFFIIIRCLSLFWRICKGCFKIMTKLYKINGNYIIDIINKSRFTKC